MKIGVTGAFGLLGSNLIKHMIEKEHINPDTITAYYSKNTKNALIDKYNITLQHLDITNYHEVLQNTKDVDILFHSAGLLEFRKKYAKKAWEINTIGTYNIFRAVAENKIGKCIYISTINVLGSNYNSKSFGDETSSLYESLENGPNSFSSSSEALKALDNSLKNEYSFLSSIKIPYYDSKLAAYELAKKLQKENVPIIIAMPGTIVGAGDINFSITELLVKVYNNTVPISLPGSSSFVSAVDCAKGIWLAATRGKIGDAYIVTGKDEDNMGYRDFMKKCALVFSKKYKKRFFKNFILLPKFIPLFITTLSEFLNPNTSANRGLFYSALCKHRFTSKKAFDALGYKAEMPLDDAIVECIEFYIKNHKKTGK